MSYDILAAGHYVAGYERFELPRYKGKELWKTIMMVSEESSIAYCQRALCDFDSRVGKDATNKTKATVCAKPSLDVFHLVCMLLTTSHNIYIYIYI